jgi:hypothetical protein|tara:strand:+ start:219 stop:398 length:180 start_codon:yes stop_codon:yes gene_type:complete
LGILWRKSPRSRRYSPSIQPIETTSPRLIFFNIVVGVIIAFVGVGMSKYAGGALDKEEK